MKPDHIKRLITLTVNTLSGGHCTVNSCFCKKFQVVTQNPTWVKLRRRLRETASRHQRQVGGDRSRHPTAVQQLLGWKGKTSGNC